MRVKDCMSKNIVYVTKENTVQEIADLMSKHHIGSVPVCDNNRHVLGIVTDRDIILRTIASKKDIGSARAEEVMTKDVIKTSEDTDASWVSEIMSKNQIRRVPVVENEKLVGIVSVGDLAKNNDFPNTEVASCMSKICNSGCDCKHSE